MKLTHIIGLTMAAMTMIAAPVLAQSEPPAATSTPTQMPKNSRQSIAPATDSPPVLTLVEFDRDSEAYMLALEIVQISAPKERLIPLYSKEFPPAMEATFLAEPEFAALDREYPGFAKHVASRFSSFLIERLSANYDFFLDGMAIDFANGLTVPELREYRAFLGTSLGQSLLEFGFNELKIDKDIFAQATLQDDDALWDQTITLDRRKAGRYVSKLTAEEIDQLLAFVESPLFRKVQRINAASFEGTSSATMEQMLDDASVERVMEDAVEEFFAMEI